MNISTVKFEAIGTRFVDVLSSSPDEIAVISRLIAYLMTCKKGEI